MTLNVQRNTLQFVSVSRESLRQSPFLDVPNTVFASNATLRADIASLLARKPRCPLQFVLHTGYCGSTLLARYLEKLPQCLVLKEPEILGQISALKGAAPNEPELWHDWFRVVYAMLARPYPSDQSVVVKASSTCNWIGHSLLDHDESLKIVFLFSSLRTFLLQVLKSDQRRHWLRQHMNFLRDPLMQVPFLKNFSAENLTDAQCASTMWMINSSLCQSLLERADSHRVLALNSADLMTRPEISVVAAADFLGLINDDADRRALADLQLLAFHSKDDTLPYDAIQRGKELEDAEWQFGTEVDSAMSWADDVSAGCLRRSPFPIS